MAYQRKVPSLELMRHLLGSIDLSDFKEDDQVLSNEERRAYCAAVHAVFPKLEKEIKRFLYTQLMYISNQSTDWETVIFGRGTFNGLDLLLEHLRLANSEHIKNIVPEPNFDKHNPIGEV